MRKELESAKKQIKRLIISQQDIVAAGDFANQLLKHRYHSPDYLKNFDEFLDSDEYISMVGITIALVVSYTRPFTENNGKTATSSLSKKCIKSFTLSEKTLHYQILETRNKAVSHSDADLYDVDLGASEDRTLICPVIYRVPMIFFKRNDLIKIQKMIDKIMNYLGEAVNLLIQHHGEDFYKYLTNNK